MRFTERELTAAVTGTAKVVLAANPRYRRRDIEAAWEGLDRYRRWQLLDRVGTQILPVLVALPDVDVAPGSRATYDADQVRETVEQVVGDGAGRLRRRAVVKARTALVRTALEHLPTRFDPDGVLTIED